MHYNKRHYPKKVAARIQRHKRVRYHNDAALFHEATYSKPRKRTKSLTQRAIIQDEQL